MVYKSFGIIRTNVGLTTNIKLMVKSDYKLYLDSIDSNDDLSLSRFKKFAINKKDRYLIELRDVTGFSVTTVISTFRDFLVV